MAVEIIMPKAGMDMDEGTIIEWLKDVGDSVEEGEGILEIETDKVTMEVESPVSGVLLRRFFEEGDVVPVVTVIAYVGEAGEDVPDKPQKAGIETGAKAPVERVEGQEKIETKVDSPSLSEGVKATPYARKMANENAIDLKEVEGTGPAGEVKGRDVEQKIAQSPLAKRIAQDKGIDTTTMVGSGYQNKIMKKDVLAEVAKQESIDVSSQRSLSGIQKVVAQRMLRSHLEIPAVTQNTKVDMTDLLKFRKEINEKRQNKLTINDFIVKAVSKVLRQDKKMLVSLDDQGIIQHEVVNIGIAVALDDGLIVPVVKNADQKSLEEISEAIKALGEKARQGTLSMDDYQGSTISISNIGMFGVYSFTPIINQPNAVIIGICAIEDELALVEGQVENRKKMMISLTYDHRLINGDVAAKFSLKVRQLLENPMEILL